MRRSLGFHCVLKPVAKSVCSWVSVWGSTDSSPKPSSFHSLFSEKKSWHLIFISLAPLSLSVGWEEREHSLQIPLISAAPSFTEYLTRTWSVYNFGASDEQGTFLTLHQFILGCDRWTGHVVCTLLAYECVGRHRSALKGHLVLPNLGLLLSYPVVSDSLRPHGLQHTRPLCPSPSSEVCPSSCPLHLWCHPAMSSSDTLLSFCPQSFPASGTFQLFASEDQNPGVSASVLPRSI